MYNIYVNIDVVVYNLCIGIRYQCVCRFFALQANTIDIVEITLLMIFTDDA